MRRKVGLAARYLRGAKGDIVARRSATIAYTRLAYSKFKHALKLELEALSQSLILFKTKAKRPNDGTARLAKTNTAL